MPTKRPTYMNVISGTYIKNPQRRAKGEPTPKGGIGKYPTEQNTVLPLVWDELVSVVCPGVLGDADRIWLERTCKLQAQSRRQGAEFSAAKEILLQSYLAKLGLTPCDRNRITAAPGDTREPGDEYFE
jgi:hypothetical protein